MQRNKVTTLGELKIGDRFHKAGDKKKKLWTVKKNGEKSNEYIVQEDGDPYTRTMRGNGPVVFLRSAMETAK